jgi:hypothetical protein
MTDDCTSDGGNTGAPGRLSLAKALYEAYWGAEKRRTRAQGGLLTGTWDQLSVESREAYLAEADEALRLCAAPATKDRELRAEIDRLRGLLDSPRVDSFLDAVRLEAAHQCERWGTEHDAGKADADWFWLIGYLAGKVLRPDNTLEKRLHHVITTAAVCLNWHAHLTGERTRMRPGIDPGTLTP